MMMIYSFGLLATVGLTGAYIWMRRAALSVKTAISKLDVKQVQVGPYQIMYAERGLPGVKSSLLLVHGFSVDKNVWMRVVKRLPRDLHIIVIDLPGHGGSSTPGDEDDITLPNIARHLRQFAEAIGLTRKPFHLAGFSMGGVIAILYAAYYPDDLDKVTLMCPTMHTPKETNYQKEHIQSDRYFLPETIEDYQTLTNRMFYTNLNLHRTDIQGVLQLRQPNYHFYRRLHKSILQSYNNEGRRWLQELIGQINVPTQVMWGSHDELFHVSGVELLRELLPRCERVDILDACGHGLTIEGPGLVVKNLLAFRNKSKKTWISSQL